METKGDKCISFCFILFKHEKAASDALREPRKFINGSSIDCEPTFLKEDICKKKKEVQTTTYSSGKFKNRTRGKKTEDLSYKRPEASKVEGDVYVKKKKAPSQPTECLILPSTPVSEDKEEVKSTARPIDSQSKANVDEESTMGQKSSSEGCCTAEKLCSSQNTPPVSAIKSQKDLRCLPQYDCSLEEIDGSELSKGKEEILISTAKTAASNSQRNSLELESPTERRPVVVSEHEVSPNARENYLEFCQRICSEIKNSGNTDTVSQIPSIFTEDKIFCFEYDSCEFGVTLTLDLDKEVCNSSQLKADGDGSLWQALMARQFTEQKPAGHNGQRSTPMQQQTEV